MKSLRFAAIVRRYVADKQLHLNSVIRPAGVAQWQEVEAFWIGDAARVGYFVPLNGPLNGHPPSHIQWEVSLTYRPNEATHQQLKLNFSYGELLPHLL